MSKVYENEFKVMIISLLNSGGKVKEVSDEYGLNGMESMDRSPKDQGYQGWIYFPLRQWDSIRM